MDFIIKMKRFCVNRTKLRQTVSELSIQNKMAIETSVAAQSFFVQNGEKNVITSMHIKSSSHDFIRIILSTFGLSLYNVGGISDMPANINETKCIYILLRF